MLLKKGLFTTKNKQSVAERFVRNKVQRDYNAKRLASPKKKRVIVKARQMGFTTDIALDKLDLAMVKPYYSAFIVANNADNVKKIFQEKIKFPFENLPFEFKSMWQLVRDNSNEIRFSSQHCFDSYVRVGTSARGTTVQDLHVSEAGIIGSDTEAWNELVLGSFNAAQDITLEGTADGLNHFYDLVIRERENVNSEWDIYFYSWLWEDSYQTSPPDNDSWIDEYEALAKEYSLCIDPVKEHGLNKAQFYWYYNKARDQKELVVQEYPFTIDEAFRGSGNALFSQAKVLQAIEAAKLVQHNVENEITFWHKPIQGVEYIVSVDPVSGEGADECCISVFNTTNMVQCAEISGKIKPDEAAQIACQLGYYYNTALLAPESNGEGRATLNEIRRLDYPNIYRRHVPDPANVYGPRIPKYGFATTASNRPTMITDFRRDFEAGLITINSLKGLNQMKTFVRKDNGRIEHEAGKHDDVLFTYFIAYNVRQYAQHEAIVV
jgi:hypothetical protein